jgi:hypothetical protein
MLVLCCHLGAELLGGEREQTRGHAAAGIPTCADPGTNILRFRAVPCRPCAAMLMLPVGGRPPNFGFELEMLQLSCFNQYHASWLKLGCP